MIGTATSESGAQAISDYLGANGKGMLLNVTDPASIESVLGNIRAEFGEVDIPVNNAGITRDNLLMRMKDDEWNDIIETNLSSVFRLSKAVMRAMMKSVTAALLLSVLWSVPWEMLVRPTTRGESGSDWF